ELAPVLDLHALPAREGGADFAEDDGFGEVLGTDDDAGTGVVPRCGLWRLLRRRHRNARRGGEGNCDEQQTRRARPPTPHRHSREGGNPVPSAIRYWYRVATPLDYRLRGNDGGGGGNDGGKQ